MHQLAVADFLTETVRAEVVDPSTGHPLWREEHLYDAERSRKRIHYFGTRDEPLGTKTVVFHDTSTLPSVRWEAPDGGHTELRAHGRRATLVRQAGGKAEAIRSILPVPDRAVADAGLEILVRKAWKTLIYGRSVRFSLWRAETSRFFPYELRRCGFGRWKGRPVVHFSVEPERGDWTTQPVGTRISFDAYTRSPIRQTGPLPRPAETLEVRSARFDVDLPIPGPLSRPDVTEDDE